MRREKSGGVIEMRPQTRCALHLGRIEMPIDLCQRRGRSSESNGDIIDLHLPRVGAQQRIDHALIFLRLQGAGGIDNLTTHARCLYGAL